MRLIKHDILYPPIRGNDPPHQWIITFDYNNTFQSSDCSVCNLTTVHLTTNSNLPISI